VRTESKTPTAHKFRVLVVNDDFGLLEVFESWLKREGFETDGAVYGATALKKLQAGHYDLVITDVQMPDMNGIQLIHEIRKACFSLPVIIISAAEPIVDGAVTHFKLPGDITLHIEKSLFDDVLRTPFGPSDFISVVRKVLGAEKR
jgi:CheY-like chemotaxis protein